MLRLRQVALITTDLERVRRQFFSILGLTEAYEDPAVGEFGLRNLVLPVGDTFIELLNPTKAGTSASRFLEKQGGDAGYMLILQTDDLRKMSQRVENLGIRKTWEHHQDNAHVFHMHPKDTGGAILSFDEMSPADSWAWAGPGWQRRAAVHVGSITAVDVVSSDAAGLARRWEPLFGRGASNSSDVWLIQLDDGVLRIRGSALQGTKIEGIEVAARDQRAALDAAIRQNVQVDGNTVTLCGVRLKLVAA